MDIGLFAPLGIGVGWLREELEAGAMPCEQRGPRTDELVVNVLEPAHA